MTPNQRHNRRMMLQLLVMAAAIMALSVGEEMRAERDAKADPESAKVAQTHAPGSRAVLPAMAPEQESVLDNSSFLQVVSSAEFQTWLDSSMSSEWDSAVSDCLYAWWLLDQGIEGNLGLEFVIGPEGLREAAVVHHKSVPDGPAQCLSETFYGTPWPTTSGETLAAAKTVVFSSGSSTESSAEVPLAEKEREEK